MKKFVVTGCSGYIGSHMCYELRKAYPDCFIIGIDDKRLPENNFGMVNKFIHTCLGNSEAIGQICDYDIDCIFHFAAYASVPEGEQRPYAYYKNNIKSTMDIMDTALISGAKAFVFSSTCAVYFPTGNKLSEDGLRIPNSIYGKTKLICEDFLLSQNIIPTAILRYFNAAGRNQKADLKENHNPETHLIPILHQNNQIEIFGKNYNTLDGTAIRDYMHVMDICAAHIKAYEYLIENKKNIICNLGTGKGYSVKEIVNLCSSIFEKKYDINYCEKRPGDAEYLVSDITRMINVLKFLPQYDIIDIIKSMK